MTVPRGPGDQEEEAHTVSSQGLHYSLLPNADNLAWPVPCKAIEEHAGRSEKPGSKMLEKAREHPVSLLSHQWAVFKNRASEKEFG